MLWKAPEFLRYAPQASGPTQSLASIVTTASMESTNVNGHNSIYSMGSQKGDVYSFSLVLYEIIGRQGPWGRSNLKPKDVTCNLFFLFLTT